jgi:multimeric flavodoxin WrbA
MKVLIINGSPRANGNTQIALNEVARSLEQEGIETVIVNIGTQPVRGCVACSACHKKKGKCAFSDPLYDQLHDILSQGVDGLVVGSPVYYAGPNGSLCALLDRLFYSAGAMLSYKPAAAVAVCRRGGASACFDRLNKYFTINNMPVVSSQYWNSVHGWEKGEAEQDAEGLQTMRTLAKNMAWMMRTLASEKHPESEQPKIRTNFIGQ